MKAAMMCRRCGDVLVAAASGGPRPEPLIVCPRYRWWHLFLHDCMVLGRP